MPAPAAPTAQSGGLCQWPDPPAHAAWPAARRHCGAGSATAWTMSITANYVVEATGHRGDGARLRRVCVAPGCASLQLAFTSRQSTAVAANRIAARTGSPGRRRCRQYSCTTSVTQICLQTVRSEPGSIASVCTGHLTTPLSIDSGDPQRTRLCRRRTPEAFSPCECGGRTWRGHGQPRSSPQRQA